MMLETGLGAGLLFGYLTAPFLVIFLLLVFLSFRRGRAEGLGTHTEVFRAVEVAWLIGVGVVWLAINIVSIPWIPGCRRVYRLGFLTSPVMSRLSGAPLTIVTL
jgi:cytochrome c oxidase subunit 2